MGRTDRQGLAASKGSGTSPNAVSSGLRLWHLLFRVLENRLKIAQDANIKQNGDEQSILPHPFCWHYKQQLSMNAFLYPFAQDIVKAGQVQSRKRYAVSCPGLVYS